MRYYLPSLLTLGFCLATAASAWAGDLERVHLPGHLGRFLGIGYSAGYYAPQPGSPTYQHPRPGKVAVACGSVLAAEDVSVLSSRSVLSDAEPSSVPSRSESQSSVAPVLIDPKPRALIQQPPRDAASPSDRSGFLRRLPNVKLRDASQISDLPPPPTTPRKASVARSAMEEPDAR